MKFFNALFNSFKALGLVLVVLPNLVSGQILWSSSGGSAWLTGGNWTGSAFPSTSQIAQFGVNPTGASGVGINMGNPTNNGTRNQGAGAVEITSSRTGAAFIIGNSSGTVANTGLLTLAGATVNSVSNTILRNNSTQLFTIQNTQGSGASTLGLVLANVTDNIINIDGTGGITISSIISGGTNKLTKAGAGNGVLTLSGANTYTGLTTVSTGTLRLNRTGGTTIPATNDITVTGGTLRISTNQTLNNLIVNGGTVTVDDGITLTINGTLTLTSGNVTLGTTGTGNVIAATISGGSSTSYVVTNGTGTLTALNFAGEKTFPVGTATTYAPVKVDNSAPSRDFSVKVGTTFSGTPAVPAKMVQLQWDVTPSVPTGNNAALTFEWPASSEGMSFVRGNAIEIAHYNGTIWDAFKLATLGGAGPYMATASGFTDFSPFTVANQSALSVDLLNISAQSKGTKNGITWSTASEKNNAYFEVQHATNSLDFQTISDKIKGNGTTNAKNDYTFDHLTPSVNVDYYRLKQVDNDGTATLSKVVSVVATGKNGALKVYPTLASDKLNISLDSKETVDFNIYNLVGQSVQSGQLTGQKELIISHLPNGAYFLKVGNTTVKFSKN